VSDLPGYCIESCVHVLTLSYLKSSCRSK